MKKIYFVILCLMIMFGLSNCNTENSVRDNEPSSSAEKMYQTAMNFPTYTLWSDYTQTTKSSFKGALPKFTEDSFKILLESYIKENTYYLYSDVTIEHSIDSIESSNTEYLYDKLGGNLGLIELETFATQYLDMEKGWISIEKIIPKNLSEEKQKIYVGMALWTDYIG